MRAELRSWWQKIKERRVTILVVAIILIVTIALIIVEVKSYGTGFTGKTLWDWFNLLGVLAIPAVVGLGAAWFTTQQGKVSERENKDNQHEKALQDYIDKMSELLLNEHLGELTDKYLGELTAKEKETKGFLFFKGQEEEKLKPKYEQIRNIARVRTITVLFQLDARRIGYVFTFLREAGLMSTTSESIVSLLQANLRSINFSQASIEQADLSGAFLSDANLSGANLSDANLNIADLSGANLRDADFSGTNLISAAEVNAVLSGAHLRDADLTGAEMEAAQCIKIEKLEKQAKSLAGATMPDGSKHP